MAKTKTKGRKSATKASTNGHKSAKVVATRPLPERVSTPCDEISRGPQPCRQNAKFRSGSKKLCTWHARQYEADGKTVTPLAPAPAKAAKPKAAKPKAAKTASKPKAKSTKPKAARKPKTAKTVTEPVAETPSEDATAAA